MTNTTSTSSLNLDSLIERETNKIFNDDTYVGDKDSLRNNMSEVITSYFLKNVTFNTINRTLYNNLKTAISKGYISDIQNTVLVRSTHLTNLANIINYFKQYDDLNFVAIDPHWTVIENCTCEHVYDFGEIFSQPVNFITLTYDRLTEFRKLLSDKKFTYSKDKKFLASNKRYKLVVRVNDNFSNNEIHNRVEHYQKVISKFANTLHDNGYATMIGSSAGYPGLGVTVFCDELPNLNILKLYRLSNVSISIPENVKILSNSMFDEIFSYFI